MEEMVVGSFPGQIYYCHQFFFCQPLTSALETLLPSSRICHFEGDELIGEFNRLISMQELASRNYPSNYEPPTNFCWIPINCGI